MSKIAPSLWQLIPIVTIHLLLILIPYSALCVEEGGVESQEKSKADDKY